MIGVDPGINGAICKLKHGRMFSIHDMPTKKIVVGKKNRNTIDLIELRKILIELKPTVAYVEKLQSRPHHGGVQNFNMGMAYGQILGALAMFNCRIELVTPQAWKKSLGVTSDKQTSVDAYHQIFHNHPDLVKLKKHVDRAEAALIAYYGSKQIKEI